MALHTYPKWSQRYSNEDFDRAQDLAIKITKMQNRESVGYTTENFRKAEKIVRAAKHSAQTYEV